jgi:hypothetical protein
MKRPHDELLPPLEQFQAALAGEVAGRERDWAEQVRRALAQVQEALQRHAADTAATAGPFAEVDLTRPSLVRQVGELRREHAEFLEHAASLQKELAHAALAFQRPADAATPAGGLPAPAPVPAVADFSAIRHRGEQLAAALQEHRGREAGLVIESVTTDIGAGD